MIPLEISSQFSSSQASLSPFPPFPLIPNMVSEQYLPPSAAMTEPPSIASHKDLFTVIFDPPCFIMTYSILCHLWKRAKMEKKESLLVPSLPVKNNDEVAFNITEEDLIPLPSAPSTAMAGNRKLLSTIDPSFFDAVSGSRSLKHDSSSAAMQDLHPWSSPFLHLRLLPPSPLPANLCFPAAPPQFPFSPSPSFSIKGYFTGSFHPPMTSFPQVNRGNISETVNNSAALSAAFSDFVLVLFVSLLEEAVTNSIDLVETISASRSKVSNYIHEMSKDDFRTGSSMLAMAVLTAIADRMMDWKMLASEIKIWLDFVKIAIESLFHAFELWLIAEHISRGALINNGHHCWLWVFKWEVFGNSGKDTHKLFDGMLMKDLLLVMFLFAALIVSSRWNKAAVLCVLCISFQASCGSYLLLACMGVLGMLKASLNS